jgi:hypothetical protein
MIAKAEIDPRAQYNFVFFRPGVFEAEKVQYAGETNGPKLLLKQNNDLYAEVTDLVAWLSRKQRNRT